MDVAATSSRLTKVARIAALLHRAAPDTQLVTIIVSWLSGELPQRHIGVGWAALRSLPRRCAATGILSGAKGTRTPDPHTASVVRYQLRHSPMK